MTFEGFMEKAREVDRLLKELVSEFEQAMAQPSPEQQERLAHADRLLASRNRNLARRETDLRVKDMALARVIEVLDEARQALDHGETMPAREIIGLIEKAIYRREAVVVYTHRDLALGSAASNAKIYDLKDESE